MRILYVTPDVPWPLTSGYLRHYHFIRALSERHAVTLLSLRGPEHVDSDEAALEPFVEEVVTEPAARGGRPLWIKVADRVRVLLGGGEVAAGRLGRAGGRRARSVPFDVLLLSGKRTMPVLAGLPPMPLVADLCDATSSRILGQIQHAGPLEFPALALEYAEMRRVEGALLRRAHHTVFASERDRAALLGRDPGRPAGAQASVIPNGVDLAFWQRSVPALGRDEIVLTGAMDYPPNSDAAVQLVERILPRVREAVPTARVSIVGRDPSPRVRALADRPGVTVTGFVDDVRPYLERAAVFAAPIRHGAGIQNKVLEAMAMEVPVVASPLAAAGLVTEGGMHPPIDVADVGRMPERIVERLRAAERGAAPDDALRAYVQTYFDWSRSAARLEAILAEAATSDPGAGA